MTDETHDQSSPVGSRWAEYQRRGESAHQLIQDGDGEEAFTRDKKTYLEEQRQKRKLKRKRHPRSQNLLPQEERRNKGGDAMKTNINPETKELGRKKAGVYIIVVGVLGLVALISNEDKLANQKLEQAQAMPPTPTAEILARGEEVLAEFAVNQPVVVHGTGNQGLRLHAQPGLESEMTGSAWDGDRFIIKEGPVQRDGHSWYEVEDPQTGHHYWAASKYLTPDYSSN